jgi:hypothetical protein
MGLVDGRAATATLIFLPRTAWTWVIPSNLVASVRRIGSTRACIGFPVLPEVPICRDQPGRHRHNCFFASLCTKWLGTHGRIFGMLR